MNSYITVKITGKDVKRFVLSLYKRNFNLYNIKYIDNYCFLTLDYRDFLKLQEIKTIYEIEIIKLHGFVKVKYFLSQYKIFLISCVIGLIFMLLLSSLITSIEVMNNSASLREFMYEELEKYGIKKFNFAKGFFENERLADEILKNNRDKIEWMEIERIGNKYVVKVEERKINNNEEDTTPRDIIAKKKGIILSIEATNGEVLKKINDYVNPGDVIISGSIKNKDEIKDIIRANGKVMAEVWYNVQVELPNNYKETKETGNKKIVFSLDFFNKSINNSSYNEKNRNSIFTISNNILPISLGIYEEKELINIDEIYTNDYAIIKASDIAREKLKSTLGTDDEIIYEKCLKMTTKDSKIILDIFFKVKEDITAYQDIVLSENNNNDNNQE